MPQFPVDTRYLHGQDQFSTEGLVNSALQKFKRPKYGFGEVGQRYLSNLSRQSGQAGQEYANRVGATTPSNVAARLNRFQEAGRLGADIYQQGAIPFAVQEAQFGEGQLQADRAAGLGLFRTIEERDRYLRSLLAGKYGQDKASQFSFGDLAGNIIGAGAQVGAAYLGR